MQEDINFKNNFVESFVKVNGVVYLEHDNDLKKYFSEIVSTLKDTNNDWEKRINSMKTIRKLLLAACDDYPSFAGTHLRSLAVPLKNTMKDLRSSCVQEVCVTVSFMAERIGKMMDPIADILLVDICMLSSFHVKKIFKSASYAAQSIIMFCSNIKIINVLFDILNASKDVNVKSELCFLMHRLVSYWDKSRLEKRLSVIKDFIVKGLNDSNNNVKEKSRSIFLSFEKKFISESKKIYNSLSSKDVIKIETLRKTYQSPKRVIQIYERAHCVSDIKRVKEFDKIERMQKNKKTRKLPMPKQNDDIIIDDVTTANYSKSQQIEEEEEEEVGKDEEDGDMTRSNMQIEPTSINQPSMSINSFVSDDKITAKGVRLLASQAGKLASIDSNRKNTRIPILPGSSILDNCPFPDENENPIKELAKSPTVQPSHIPISKNPVSDNFHDKTDPVLPSETNKRHNDAPSSLLRESSTSELLQLQLDSVGASNGVQGVKDSVHVEVTSSSNDIEDSPQIDTEINNGINIQDTCDCTISSIVNIMKFIQADNQQSDKLNKIDELRTLMITLMRQINDIDVYEQNNVFTRLASCLNELLTPSCHINEHIIAHTTTLIIDFAEIMNDYFEGIASYLYPAILRLIFVKNDDNEKNGALLLKSFHTHFETDLMIQNLLDAIVNLDSVIHRNYCVHDNRGVNMMFILITMLHFVVNDNHLLVVKAQRDVIGNLFKINMKIQEKSIERLFSEIRVVLSSRIHSRSKRSSAERGHYEVTLKNGFTSDIEPPGLDVDREIEGRTPRPFAPPVLLTHPNPFGDSVLTTPLTLEPTLCSQICEREFNKHLAEQKHCPVLHRSLDVKQRPVNRFPYNDKCKRYDGSYLRRQRRRQQLPFYEDNTPDVSVEEDVDVFLMDLLSPSQIQMTKNQPKPTAQNNTSSSEMHRRPISMNKNISYPDVRDGAKEHIPNYRMANRDSQYDCNSIQLHPFNDNSSPKKPSDLEVSNQFVADQTFEESQYLVENRRRIDYENEIRVPEYPQLADQQSVQKLDQDNAQPQQHPDHIVRGLGINGVHRNRELNNKIESLPTYEQAVKSPLRIPVNKSAYKKVPGSKKLRMSKEDALMAQVALPEENVRRVPYAIQEECMIRRALDKTMTPAQVNSAAVKAMAERVPPVAVVSDGTKALTEEEVNLKADTTYLHSAKLHKAIFVEHRKKFEKKQKHKFYYKDSDRETLLEPAILKGLPQTNIEYVLNDTENNWQDNQEHVKSNPLVNDCFASAQTEVQQQGQGHQIPNPESGRSFYENNDYEFKGKPQPRNMPSIQNVDVNRSRQPQVRCSSDQFQITASCGNFNEQADREKFHAEGYPTLKNNMEDDCYDNESQRRCDQFGKPPFRSYSKHDQYIPDECRDSPYNVLPTSSIDYSPKHTLNDYAQLYNPTIEGRDNYEESYNEREYLHQKLISHARSSQRSASKHLTSFANEMRNAGMPCYVDICDNFKTENDNQDSGTPGQGQGDDSNEETSTRYMNPPNTAVEFMEKPQEQLEHLSDTIIEGDSSQEYEHDDVNMPNDVDKALQKWGYEAKSKVDSNFNSIRNVNNGKLLKKQKRKLNMNAVPTKDMDSRISASNNHKIQITKLDNIDESKISDQKNIIQKQIIVDKAISYAGIDQKQNNDVRNAKSLATNMFDGYKTRIINEAMENYNKNASTKNDVKITNLKECDIESDGEDDVKDEMIKLSRNMSKQCISGVDVRINQMNESDVETTIEEITPPNQAMRAMLDMETKNRLLAGDGIPAKTGKRSTPSGIVEVVVSDKGNVNLEQQVVEKSVDNGGNRVVKVVRDSKSLGLTGNKEQGNNQDAICDFSVIPRNIQSDNGVKNADKIIEKSNEDFRDYANKSHRDDKPLYQTTKKPIMDKQPSTLKDVLETSTTVISKQLQSCVLFTRKKGLSILHLIFSSKRILSTAELGEISHAYPPLFDDHNEEIIESFIGVLDHMICRYKCEMEPWSFMILTKVLACYSRKKTLKQDTTAIRKLLNTIKTKISIKQQLNSLIWFIVDLDRYKYDLISTCIVYFNMIANRMGPNVIKFSGGEYTRIAVSRLARWIQVDCPPDMETALRTCINNMYMLNNEELIKTIETLPCSFQEVILNKLGLNRKAMIKEGKFDDKRMQDLDISPNIAIDECTIEYQAFLIQYGNQMNFDMSYKRVLELISYIDNRVQDPPRNMLAIKCQLMKFTKCNLSMVDVAVAYKIKYILFGIICDFDDEEVSVLCYRALLEVVSRPISAEVLEKIDGFTNELVCIVIRAKNHKNIKIAKLYNELALNVTNYFPLPYLYGILDTMISKRGDNYEDTMRFLYQALKRIEDSMHPSIFKHMIPFLLKECIKNKNKLVKKYALKCLVQLNEHFYAIVSQCRRCFTEPEIKFLRRHIHESLFKYH